MINGKILDNGNPILSVTGTFNIVKTILTINTYGTTKDFLNSVSENLDNQNEEAAYKTLLKKLIEFTDKGGISLYYDSIHNTYYIKAVYAEDSDEGEHYLLLDKDDAIESLVSTFRSLFASRNRELRDYFDDRVYYPLVMDIMEYLQD